jgi:hypothetical protein
MAGRIRHVGWTLLTVYLSGGCSWITDFAVLNGSEDTLHVDYELRQRHDTRWGFVYEAPAVAPVDSVCKYGTPWTELKKDDVAFDSSMRRVSVELPSRTALRITRNLTFVGDSADSARFNVVALRLAGNSLQREIADPVLLSTFERRSPQLYIINFP